MELIDYMRKRNQMTENEWENSFDKKEQEILVLRHEGDVTSKRNSFWEVAVCCLAFISLETGELYKEDCRFVFAASYEEYDKPSKSSSIFIPFTFLSRPYSSLSSLNL